jgi:hypothetical protein
MESDSPIGRTFHVDEGVFGKWVLGFWHPRGTPARVAMLLALIADCLFFGWGTRWLRTPELTGFDGSLLAGRSAIGNVISVAMLMGVATLIGTILAGAVRFEAGLFAACTALTIVSLRCGTMQSVLFEASGSSAVYITLAFEIVILAIILAILWIMLVKLGQADGVIPMPGYTPDDSAPPAPAANLIATVTQTIVTVLIMLFLCQSDAKNQVLASLAIASVVGSMVAYGSFPTRPSFWYWAGPLIAGLAGYLLAAMGQVSQLGIGTPQGLFAPLARPLPVDYASIGTAGAILGYWITHKNRANS